MRAGLDSHQRRLRLSDLRHFVRRRETFEGGRDDGVSFDQTAGRLEEFDERRAQFKAARALLAGDGGGEIGLLGEGGILGVSFQLDVSADAMQETVRPMFPKGALMTKKPSEAYLAGYFFGRDGRRTERRFDDVVELKAHGEGIVDGRRTARAAEDGRRAIEHECSLGLHWHDRLNIQNPQVSDPDAPIDPD
jgi:hypothetical protein